MIDQLEARGYIGAFDGSNARAVLGGTDRHQPGRGTTSTGKTNDHARPGEACGRDRPRRVGARLHARLRTEPARAPVGGARAQGRRPVPRGARHEDPGALPGRPRAWRLQGAPGRRLHEGLPAQLRAVPRSRPRRRPAPVAPRARGRQGNRTGHRRPAPDQRAAQGPDLLAGRHRGRDHDRAVIAFGRTSWLRSSATWSHRRSHEPADRGRGRRRDDQSYTLRGTSIPGATVSIAVPSWDQPMLATADTNGAWIAGHRPPPRAQPVRHQRPRPGTQKTSDDTKIFITVPFREIETPTLSVDQPADGATFENGAIPSRAPRPTRRKSWSTRPTRARRRATRRRPRTRRPPRSRSPSTRTARSTRRTS